MTEIPIEVHRVGVADLELARRTFRLMAEVFEEAGAPLSDRYLGSLLSRQDFWALVALREGVPVGGITAHALCMTRSEATELFIYDLAVDPAFQRQGVGRSLVTALREMASASGIASSFVPADNDDAHALEFYRALGGDEAPVTIFSFE